MLTWYIHMGYEEMTTLFKHTLLRPEIYDESQSIAAPPTMAATPARTAF